MSTRLLSDAPWRRLPPELAPALRARLDATVAMVVDQVTSSIPDFAQIDDSKFENDVRRGVRVALERFLELVGTEATALPPPVRETFVELGAAEAREDRTPETLLAAIRIAARVMLRSASDALSQVRPIGSDDLVDLADAVTTFVDELAAASTDGFALQLRELAGESDRRRRQLAELLLKGTASERAVTTAAAGIGWRRIEDLVPVLVPRDQTRHARFRFQAEAVALEREHDTLFIVRRGLVSSRVQLTHTLAGRNAVVGPAIGWARVPGAAALTGLTAQLVANGTIETRPSDEPVFVDDHLAVLALRGEHEALTALSERRLAAFAGVRAATRRRLLQTLHTWLLHWGSRAGVAAELGIHPQTVSYRVKQLRDLLGDDLDDPDVRFELLLVLADHGTSDVT